jgi:zinc protease
LIEKYFSTIPSQPKPLQVDVGEPSEVAVKNQTWEDKLAPLPAFLIGWKVPPRRTKDFYALYLAGKLLYDGESSRLYQKLVKGEESVLQLFGFTDERRGPSMAVIGAIPKPDQDVKQIRQVIFDEISEISINGVSIEEMEKLHNQLINDEIRQRQSSISRAKQIAEYALYDNEPELINTELENYLQVTAEEIKLAVHKYLNTENRSELDVIPTQK